MTKFYIQAKLHYGESIRVFNFLYFTLTYNKGIAFGLFPKGGKIFLVINSLLLIYLIVLALKYLKGEMDFSQVLPLIFILGGAIGNLIDRLRVGAIVDFIDFRVWPIFNLADSFITLGIILLLKDIIFHARKGT